jgi:hypothetical protein
MEVLMDESLRCVAPSSVFFEANYSLLFYVRHFLPQEPHFNPAFVKVLDLISSE